MSYLERSSGYSESECSWQERRLAAVERMATMEVDVPLDPDELSRELEAAHEPGGLGRILF